MPLQKGYRYLVAILDLFSRNVLSWKLPKSLDKEFFVEALEMTMEGSHKQKISHSDQACQGGFNRSMQHPLPG
jgi:putative transposase